MTLLNRLEGLYMQESGTAGIWGGSISAPLEPSLTAGSTTLDVCIPTPYMAKVRLATRHLRRH